MFMLPILIGAALFYLFAVLIYTTSNDPVHLKTRSVWVMIFWGGLIGAIIWILLGVSAIITYASNMRAFDTLLSLTGLAFFIWLGFAAASAYTMWHKAE